MSDLGPGFDAREGGGMHEAEVGHFSKHIRMPIRRVDCLVHRRRPGPKLALITIALSLSSVSALQRHESMVPLNFFWEIGF